MINATQCVIAVQQGIRPYRLYMCGLPYIGLGQLANALCDLGKAVSLNPRGAASGLFGTANTRPVAARHTTVLVDSALTL